MKKIITLLIISFNTICYGQIIPPYVNYFDNPLDTTGWTHYAIYGTDDWEMGIPSNYSFTSAYSSPNVWGTNLTGSYAANSSRALETPYYDLSDTSTSLVFSFYQKRKSIGTAHYYVEYTDDQGSTWQILNNAVAKRNNWQTSSGFSGNNQSWQKSAINIGFIQGQDSIKFRFRYVSNTGNEAGWMIDNFSIVEEYYNVTATQGDSVLGLNKYFTNFTVKSTFVFNNQWSDSYSFQSDFYLSTDSIIDSSDIFLGSVNNTLNNNLPNWSNTFNLPAGLSAGTYYVIYELDKLNVLIEANENDNSSYAILIIDSIYAAPYIENFDTTFQSWNSASNGSSSTWVKGDPNGWHVEDPRSGTDAWVSKSSQIGFNNYLESPYLDLSSSLNSVVCLWYRTSSNSWTLSGLSLQLPTFGNTSIAQPYYPAGNNTTIPHSRLYTWDCFCKDISDYDGELSTKIRFSGFGNVNPTALSQYLIDDVYIGEARPDAAIESLKTNRYTSSGTTIDTLDYLFFNSGLANLANTVTEFYWSNDSILDAGDVLLGSKIEPSMTDTSFQWQKFTYTKPTTSPGKYFIIYKADATNQVIEMREYDNIGYFEIHQNNQESLPYFNDFETSITGWRHNSTLGEDEWVWGTPQGTYLDSAFSGTKAFITNDTGIVSSNSRMHLYSPQFNLTQLQKPVMEFDFLAHFYGVNNYSLWPYNMGNIMYSINGGATWEVLDTTNLSFKRLYYRLELETIGGNDRIPINGSGSSKGELLYGKNLPMFRTHLDYQGRDYDDNHHYVVDLSFLQQSEPIQFMFVFANYNAPMEGMMIDNFEIREAEIDLMKPSKKKLMVSSADQKIKQNIIIKNNNNYISEATGMNIYCSNDTILDISDAFVGAVNLRKIRPYQNCLSNINLPTPPNYGSYNYLILEIDPLNLNIESNEANNITFFELNMDTAANFSYPVLFDFEEEEVNGWTWYHDSTGYTSRHGHRFRHYKVIKDVNNNVQNGEWFLDPIDMSGYHNSIAGYPNYYLETPPYNFTNLSNIELEFDFMCMGDNYIPGSGTQGGNIQYSINGGQTWTILTTTQDPSAQNWYNLSSIQSLSGEPGWGEWPNWSTAVYNLSFLSGTPSVRFRYKFRSENMYNSLVNHGFRLDNFKISAAITTQLSPITICQGDSVLVFGNYQNVAGNYYDTLLSINGIDSILIQQLSLTVIDTSISTISNILTSNSSGSSYQWLDCNNNYAYISGATNQNYTALTNGSYAVEITKNGCIDTSSCYSIIVIGVNEVINHLGILIYPNPNTGLFTIEKPTDLNKELKVRLLDATSKLILDKVIPIGKQKVHIDITNYSNGIYYLQLIIDEEITVKLILKNK